MSLDDPKHNCIQKLEHIDNKNLPDTDKALAMLRLGQQQPDEAIPTVKN